MARKLAVVAGHALIPDWWPDAAAEHGLSANDLLVFFLLCTRAEPDRAVLLAQTRIARELGIGHSTVKRALPRLVAAGFLVDLGQSGRRAPHAYRISLSRPLPPHRLGIPTVRAKHAGSGWLEAL